MAIFKKTPRQENREVSEGKQAPRNLDRNNIRIAKALEYSDSIQSILKGWERNLDKIKKSINEKLIELDSQGADDHTKEYYVRKILTKWGGPAAIWKDLIPKI